MVIFSRLVTRSIDGSLKPRGAIPIRTNVRPLFVWTTENNNYEDYFLKLLIPLGNFYHFGAMMKKQIAVLCLSGQLCGCVNADLSKLVPGSLTVLQTSLQTTADREATLISELQLENDTLDFMSAGTYACGDPQDKKQRSFLSAKDPAQFVKEEAVNKAWQKSLIFLAAYLKALNSIVDANKQEQDDITSSGKYRGRCRQECSRFSCRHGHCSGRDSKKLSVRVSCILTPSSYKRRPGRWRLPWRRL